MPSISKGDRVIGINYSYEILIENDTYISGNLAAPLDFRDLKCQIRGYT